MPEGSDRADADAGLVWTELPACPVCGSAARRPFARYAHTTDHPYVQCRGCSLVYLSPRPVYDERYLARAYGWTAPRGAPPPGPQPLGHDDRKVVNRSVDLMNTVERLVPRKGALLDIGCADGFLLGIARDRGWRVSGVDLSEGALEVCRRKGLDVRREDVTANPPDRRYDVVTACHVLEHTASPVDFLVAVRERVSDSGLVVVEVPNVDGPDERLKRRVRRHRLKPPFVTGLAHLFEFTERAFKCAAGRAGLETIIIYSYGHDSRRTWFSELRRKVQMRFLWGSKFRFFLRPRHHGGTEANRR